MRRVEDTGSPLSVAGRNFHCLSAFKAISSRSSLPVELTSFTDVLPSGFMMNRAMQHDLKHCSCKSDGISGRGALSASAGRKSFVCSVPMLNSLGAENAGARKIAETRTAAIKHALKFQTEI